MGTLPQPCDLRPATCSLITRHCPLFTGLRESGQDVSRVTDAVDEVFQANMLVGGVGSIARIADASGDHGQAQGVNERVNMYGLHRVVYERVNMSYI